VPDECHYMNDHNGYGKGRTSLFIVPRNSASGAFATIKASDRLMIGLIDTRPDSTNLLRFRPVPLEFHFGNTKGHFLLDKNTETMTQTQKR